MEIEQGICSGCGHEIDYQIIDGTIKPETCVCGLKFSKVITSPTTGTRVLTS